MNKQVIIAIVGMPGAGKSETAKFFLDQGIPVLRFGDQTDIGLREFHLERNEKNERWYREKLRNELGMAAMAIKIEPRVLETLKKHTMVILDGLYSWEEFLYLKTKFPDLLLLCIYAAPPIRYARLAKRSVRPLTREEAEGRDKAELEHLNKGGPIAMADYLIKNESKRDDLYKELQALFHSFYEKR